MKELRQKMLEVITSSGLDRLTIIYNGKSKTEAGKKIYVEVDGNWLKFMHAKNLNGKKDYEEIPGYYNSLEKLMFSTTFAGMNFDFTPMIEDMRIECDSTSGELILESALWSIARNAVEHGGNVTVQRNGVVMINSLEMQQLKQAFMEEALRAYATQVYDKTSNVQRTIKRLNPTYFVKPDSFVPVFVDVDRYFNPYEYITNATNTYFHRECERIGRLWEGEGIRCYFMSHLEICKAFRMTQFARFTPSVWFNIYTGLLGYKSFPTVHDYVYIDVDSERVISEKTAKEADPESFRRVLSLQYFLETKHNDLMYLGAHWLDEYVAVSQLVAIYGGAVL